MRKKRYWLYLLEAIIQMGDNEFTSHDIAYRMGSNFDFHYVMSKLGELARLGYLNVKRKQGSVNIYTIRDMNGLRRLHKQVLLNLRRKSEGRRYKLS